MLSPKKAKENCGYKDKPVLPVCSNCRHFTSDRVLPDWMVDRNKSGEGAYFSDEQFTVEKHGVEKNLRCKAHGFVVKKMGSCNTWNQELSGA